MYTLLSHKMCRVLLQQPWKMSGVCTLNTALPRQSAGDQLSAMGRCGLTARPGLKPSSPLGDNGRQGN